MAEAITDRQDQRSITPVHPQEVCSAAAAAGHPDRTAGHLPLAVDPPSAADAPAALPVSAEAAEAAAAVQDADN